MNDPAGFHDGMEDSSAAFERRLRSAAQGFSYPPAPDVRAAVRQRLFPGPRGRHAGIRLALAAIVLALVAAGLMAVPPVRAAVLNWLRIGAVQIWFVQPSATPTAMPRPEATSTVIPTRLSSPTPLASILDLSGETNLAKAHAQAGFPLRLPGFPTDAGQPDHVYFQDLGGPVVVLVWIEKSQSQKVSMVISETDSSNVIFQKFDPQSIEQTQVNGQAAVWVDAPYYLVTGTGGATFTRMVERGHTLIWTAGKMTFRLETGEDLATALRIAESMQVEP